MAVDVARLCAYSIEAEDIVLMQWSTLVCYINCVIISSAILITSIKY